MRQRDMNDPSRNLLVDLFRGICILAVLMMHLSIFLPDKAGIPKAALWAYFHNGYYGVVGFFVISGYLITHHSFRRFGSLSLISPLKFYSYRAGRILPMLLFTLLILVSLHWWEVAAFVVPPRISVAESVFAALTAQYNLFWLRQWAQGNDPGLQWMILWSLSVELAFYAAFPFLCVALRRTSTIVAGLLAVMAFCIIYRSTAANEDALIHHFACFDYIALGCLIAIIGGSDLYKLAAKRNFVRLSLLSTGLTACIVAYTTFDVSEDVAFGGPLIAIGVAALLLFANYEEHSRAAMVYASPLSAIGKYSYELYLIHMIVLLLIYSTFASNLLLLWPFKHGLTLFIIFGYLSICMAASVLLSRAVSQPVNRSFRVRLVPVSLS